MFPTIDFGGYSHRLELPHLFPNSHQVLFMTTSLQVPSVPGRLWRLALLLLLLAGPGVAYASDSQPLLEQPVTLRATDERMASVLSKIENQVSVHFQYSRQLIGAGRRVSLNAVDQPLAQVLTQLLAPLRIDYRVINDGILLKPALAVTAPDAAADPTVTGRVVDEKGAGLPGVNVVIKGGTNGTQTDLDGKF